MDSEDRRRWRVAEHSGGPYNGPADELRVICRPSSHPGSTVVYPHGDKNLRPVELGASIFVDANRNLVKGAKVSEAVSEPRECSQPNHSDTSSSASTSSNPSSATRAWPCGTARSSCSRHRRRRAAGRGGGTRWPRCGGTVRSRRCGSALRWARSSRSLRGCMTPRGSRTAGVWRASTSLPRAQTSARCLPRARARTGRATLSRRARCGSTRSWRRARVSTWVLQRAG